MSHDQLCLSAMSHRMAYLAHDAYRLQLGSDAVKAVNTLLLLGLSESQLRLRP